ncbi:MAG: LysM peptidoglycan-binding domain-containing protein [Verrucomicrobiota bacterium]
MNTPNPLIPQGSLPSRKKSTVYIAFFTIFAIHIVFLGGLLIQGCKKSETKPAEETNAAPVFPPMTNDIPPVDTTTNPPPPPVNTNVETHVEPTPAVPTNEGGQEYIIAKGDTYSVIAKKMGVTVKALERANPGVNPNKLQISKKLQVPAPTASSSSAASFAPSSTAGGDTASYTVKGGDMLEKIARRNGTTVKAIMAANNLKTTKIHVGQKLKLPAGKTADAAAPGFVTPLPSPSAGSTNP